MTLIEACLVGRCTYYVSFKYHVAYEIKSKYTFKVAAKADNGVPRAITP